MSVIPPIRITRLEVLMRFAKAYGSIPEKPRRLQNSIDFKTPKNPKIMRRSPINEPISKIDLLKIRSIVFDVGNSPSRVAKMRKATPHANWV